MASMQSPTVSYGQSASLINNRRLQILCSSSRLNLRICSLYTAKNFSSDSQRIRLFSHGEAQSCSSFQTRSFGSSNISDRRLPSSNWRSDHTMASSQLQKSVHDFTVKDARGKDVDLSIYKGKVLLIVNVASQCGLTNSNYTALAQIYEKYKNEGLEILAFPCNQFNGQEPGTNEEILQFACTRFKAEYPIFDKVDVNGPNASPLYKFLKSSKGGFLVDKIKWNFTKFLVDKDGKVIDRYAPTTSPHSIEKHIKKLLGTKS